MELDLKSFATTQLEDVKKRYLQDLEALSDESFDRSPGGVARKPSQFTYEIVCVNSRFLQRLNGEDPGPFNPEIWTSTPEEYRSKAGGTKAFADSMDQMLAAVEATPADQMLREIPLPSGKTSPFDLALFCVSHVGYHDGQLNYFQALNGDGDMHWAD